ncbi:hypothetical protein RRF57_002894 [Xylaria bambusicola]|uniref:Uncharacterized protein n=1 Tax=Xylaria bambusicola TaxID=326684 RepID=A0AAN7UJP6_9PEZI
MAAKAPFKTTYAAKETIRPIFTGGTAAIENNARILATTLGEDAILTDIKTGKHLAKIEGVSSPDSNICAAQVLKIREIGWRAHFDTDL